MRIKTGQLFLILCCIFYLIWWYRGYHPNNTVSRISGVNGILFLLTAAFGIAGLIFSLTPVDTVNEPKFNASAILISGFVGYVVLFLITRYGFHRMVTTELFLIVGWTMLEVSVINRLNAAGALSDKHFTVMCFVIAAAFLISMILYVAYYRMEEMRAFYAAMVPLVVDAAAMAAMIGIVLSN